MTGKEARGVYAVIVISLTSIDSPIPSSRSTPSTSTPSAPAGRWLLERLLHRRMGYLNQEYVR
jgi:hypothetical protein